jgi:3-oxoacyl-[acyl-carrier-protein] synthase-3
LAVEIRQGSNGGLAALELAASHLAARPGGAALITTGDAFRLPYVDRWASDAQQVYGDGAGALVLSADHGFARLVSTASCSDSTLEPLYRGTAGWTETPFATGKPVDLAARKSDYLLQHEDLYDEVIAKMVKNGSATLQQALDDAGITLEAARFLVHPVIGETIATMSFHQRLGVDRSRTTYDWGVHLGHTGAGDQLLGLNHLVESRRPQPGDMVVMIGVGIGYVWTAAVLEFLDTPAW